MNGAHIIGRHVVNMTDALARDCKGAGGGVETATALSRAAMFDQVVPRLTLHISGAVTWLWGVEWYEATVGLIAHVFVFLFV